MTKNYATIHDPAIGKRKVSIKQLSHSFTGVALEIWSKVKFKKGKSEQISLYEILKHMSEVKIKVFSLSTLIELVGLLMLVGTKLVMDHVMSSKDKSLLFIICLGLLLFTFFHFISQYAKGMDFFESGLFN
ncbi:cysteine peptidase family C39 domain-containing protein [Aggregatibacter actinomycetemcomitans]|uniref:cysteine peptidase family C39 domain-containing protein n=1 Tax=Aggregatibacter actinomycetemcomitans TaxID=714 RepID=UPI001F2707CD|nr:cysteine peptidase family C39 domain-containing protein [Aggregatibacter actinomycetemcomitans]